MNDPELIRAYGEFILNVSGSLFMILIPIVIAIAVLKFGNYDENDR